MTQIIFRGWAVPGGFESDGCTWAPDRLFGVDLRPACVWHDWARRHLVHYRRMTVGEADKLFRDYLVQLGAPKWLARVYWFGVKFMRPWFRATRPLPTDNWRRYLSRDGGTIS